MRSSTVLSAMELSHEYMLDVLAMRTKGPNGIMVDTDPQARVYRRWKRLFYACSEYLRKRFEKEGEHEQQE